MAPPIASRLLPRELVEAALQLDRAAFVGLYGATLLLLVRLGPSGEELLSGLAATAVRGSSGTSLRPAARAMEFYTAFQPAAADDRPDSTDASRRRSRLAEQLSECAHFALPLRKRSQADALRVDRITVGRARNKDVVLHDASVSKLHGWFEIDELGGVYVSDAGSRNATRVNERKLVAGERARVEPGDSIRFGSVVATVCSPSTLWVVLNQPSRE